MPAESCGEIKASERRMAISGRYWLEPQETNMKSKKFLVIKLLFFNQEKIDLYRKKQECLEFIISFLKVIHKKKLD